MRLENLLLDFFYCILKLEDNPHILLSNFVVYIKTRFVILFISCSVSGKHFISYFKNPNQQQLPQKEINFVILTKGNECLEKVEMTYFIFLLLKFKYFLFDLNYYKLDKIFLFSFFFSLSLSLTLI